MIQSMAAALNRPSGRGFKVQVRKHSAHRKLATQCQVRPARREVGEAFGAVRIDHPVPKDQPSQAEQIFSIAQSLQTAFSYALVK
jgi:hypothetical protein